MPIRLLAVLAILLSLSACMARRASVEEVTGPVPSGITPLTVEQDDQIEG